MGFSLLQNLAQPVVGTRVGSQNLSQLPTCKSQPTIESAVESGAHGF